MVHGICRIVIGLIFALLDKHTLPLLNPTLSDVVLALAISTGSNAANSLMKFGENVKEARKKEVQPLPELKLTPAAATVSPNAKLQLLASVSGTDNKAVTWRVLELSDGGTATAIDENTGEYTAPGTAGTFHVAAVSQANPAATATATISDNRRGCAKALLPRKIFLKPQISRMTKIGSAFIRGNLRPTCLSPARLLSGFPSR